MLNEKRYEQMKANLESDGRGTEAVHNLGDDFLHEAVRLCVDQERSQLEEELRLYKRFRKMLEPYTAHEISYEIGRIDGIATVLERLSQTMPDQNEFNKIMEAVYQREAVKKILDYMYDNPHIQHKTLANAIGLKPSYLSQLLRTLEEYNCVVRYGIDRRSFFDLSLGGQTFIKKKRAGTQ